MLSTIHNQSAFSVFIEGKEVGMPYNVMGRGLVSLVVFLAKGLSI